MAPPLGRASLFHPNLMLAIEPLGDHRSVMKLDRAAILADDHQDVYRCRAGRRFALAGQHVDVDIAIRAKSPAHRAAGNMFSEEELIDLGFREVAGIAGRFSFHCCGICHRNHRGQF